MVEPQDAAFWNLLRGYSRTALAKIWQAGQAGESLRPEEEDVYRAMLDHPEWYDIWETLEYLADKDVVIDGVHPVLHVCMHSVIEGQCRTLNPPETTEAVRRLMARGMSRHEAIHRIAEVLGKHLWPALRERRPFDEEAFRQALRELGSER